MNLILQAIKSLFRKLENKIEKDIINNRSDWNQNDENGDGYIKNRPFYHEKDVEIDILPVRNYQTDDYDGAMAYKFEGRLIEGAKYIVTFNDLVETRLAVADQEGDVYLEPSNNNTDLDVKNYGYSYIEFFSWDAQGGDVHRLGLTAITDEIKQIDEKFIPDGIARAEDVIKVQEVASTQANLLQNDNTAIDYVRGKTHYEELAPSNTYQTVQFGHYASYSNSSYKYECDVNTLISIYHFTDNCTFTLSIAEESLDTNIGSISLLNNNDKQITLTGLSTKGSIYTMVVTVPDYAPSINNPMIQLSHKHYNTKIFVSINRPNPKITTHPLPERFFPGKMNQDNPVGSGTFSINRETNSTIGEKSIAIGDSVVANSCGAFVRGRYNLFLDDAYYPNIYYNSVTPRYRQEFSISYSKEYTMDKETGRFTLINPLQGTGAQLENIFNSFGSYYMSINGEQSIIYYVNENSRYLEKRHQNGNMQYWAENLTRYYLSNMKYAYYLADVVGNGTSNDARSNAYTLDWEGNAWYSGDVYVGSTSGTNKDDGSKKLATEEYVDNKEYDFFILKSSTPGSNKKFKITITDDGILSSEEVIEE